MTGTATESLPAWLAAMDEEDLGFIKRFVLASGSLKDMAEQYGVSYPTVRGRLDRLIAKLAAAEAPEPRDPFERKLRLLVADGKLPAPMAKDLLAAYRDARNRKGKS